LLNWTQQQLAGAAGVGVSTVKKFEAGQTMPTRNNLAAMQNSLDQAGAVILSDEDFGGTGVLLSRILRPVFVPFEGLSFLVRYTSLMLEGSDNDFDLWFRLEYDALVHLAGRPIDSDADARMVARRDEKKVMTAVKKVIKKRGLSAPGGGPRIIRVADLAA
jgi:transcriptional regulator with XRE-family HTH domain